MLKFVVASGQLVRCWAFYSEPSDSILLLPLLLFNGVPLLPDATVHFFDFIHGLFQLFGNSSTLSAPLVDGLDWLSRPCWFMVFFAMSYLWFGIIPLGQKYQSWLLDIFFTDDSIFLDNHFILGKICSLSLLWRSENWGGLFQLEQPCLISLFLSSGTDNTGIWGHQWWHGVTHLVSFAPWDVSHLVNLFDIWISIKICSMVDVSSTLRILKWFKGLVYSIMDKLAMQFQMIWSLVYATPRAENKRSSLRPIIINEGLTFLNCGF